MKNDRGDEIWTWRETFLLLAVCVSIGGGLFTLELWAMKQMSARDAARYHSAPNCGDGRVVDREIQPCRMEHGIIVQKYVVQDMVGPRSEYMTYRNEVGYNQDALLTTPGFYEAVRTGDVVEVTWWHGPVLIREKGRTARTSSNPDWRADRDARGFYQLAPLAAAVCCLLLWAAWQAGKRYKSQPQKLAK